MRFIVALIACLMVLTSAGVGSVARAADAVCCMDAVSGTIAVDQDGCGAAPADCDKNCAHHGACHGHQVAATADAGMATRSKPVSNMPAVAMITRLVSIDLEGSLRPPRV